MYLVVPGLENPLGILSAGKESLERRGLKIKHLDGNILEASYDHKDWAKCILDTGSSHCPENTLFDAGPTCMKLINVSVHYTHARIPSGRRPTRYGEYQWVNGEHPIVGERFGATLTCLPMSETVSISMDVEDDSRKIREIYRRDLLKLEYAIENRIKLAKVATRLIKAMKSKSANEGRTQRFINEVFIAIARI